MVAELAGGGAAGVVRGLQRRGAAKGGRGRLVAAQAGEEAGVDDDVVGRRLVAETVEVALQRVHARLGTLGAGEQVGPGGGDRHARLGPLGGGVDLRHRLVGAAALFEQIGQGDAVPEVVGPLRDPVQAEVERPLGVALLRLEGEVLLADLCVVGVHLDRGPHRGERRSLATASSLGVGEADERTHVVGPLAAGLGVGVDGLGRVAFLQQQVAERLPALVIDRPLLQALLVEHDGPAGVALCRRHLGADEATAGEVEVFLTRPLGELAGLAHVTRGERHAEVLHQEAGAGGIDPAGSLVRGGGLLGLLQALPEIGPAELLVEVVAAVAGRERVDDPLPVFRRFGTSEHQQRVAGGSGGLRRRKPPRPLGFVDPGEQLGEHRHAAGLLVEKAPEQVHRTLVRAHPLVALGHPPHDRLVAEQARVAEDPLGLLDTPLLQRQLGVEGRRGRVVGGESAKPLDLLLGVPRAVAREVDLGELAADPPLRSGAPLQRILREQRLEPLGGGAPLPLGLPRPGRKQDRLDVGLAGVGVDLHGPVQRLHRLGGLVAEQGDLALEQQHPGGPLLGVDQLGDGGFGALEQLLPLVGVGRGLGLDQLDAGDLEAGLAAPGVGAEHHLRGPTASSASASRYTVSASSCCCRSRSRLPSMTL